MQLTDSFRLAKRGKIYSVLVLNLKPNGDNMVFQFDSGASISLVGLNSLCKEDSSQIAMREILLDEIGKRKINPLPENPKTVSMSELVVYPCKCEGVSIGGTHPITFYFYIYLGNISMPLLGFDYIDDCSCSHMIGGDFIVSAVAHDVGRHFYPENVVDFNRVSEGYRKQVGE